MTTIAGCVASGAETGRITLSSTVTAAMASPSVTPATVMADRSSSGASCASSPSDPPAASNSVICVSPLGLTSVSSGTFGASSSNNRYTSTSVPASMATACRCLRQLTEPLDRENRGDRIGEGRTG